MSIIRVKKTFTLPSGVKFTKDELFYGQWDYISQLDKKTVLPLVVIYNEFRGPFLLQKEKFELIPTNEKNRADAYDVIKKQNTPQ